MSDGCVFCKIVSGDLPCARIYDSEQMLSFLDIGPITPGHCLIVPKVHADRLELCDAAVLSELGKTIGLISKAVVRVTTCSGYNVLCNNGPDAGQIVPHVHFHIIPRESGDGLFNPWPAGSYDKGEIEKMAERIQQAIC